MKEDLIEMPEKEVLRSRLSAKYTGPGHFLYSGSWSKKRELCIWATGWKARILGFIFRAKQW